MTNGVACRKSSGVIAVSVAEPMILLESHKMKDNIFSKTHFNEMMSFTQVNVRSESYQFGYVIDYKVVSFVKRKKPIEKSPASRGMLRGSCGFRR
jgi:hypothetical protein